MEISKSKKKYISIFFFCFSDPFSPSGVFQNDDLNNSILSLKILAKFLGFVESLPYHYREDSLSDKLMEVSLKNRLKVSETKFLVQMISKLLFLYWRLRQNEYKTTFRFYISPPQQSE